MELVDDLACRGRVIDAGRQGPVGDVDELAQAERRVLVHRALVADGEGVPHLVGIDPPVAVHAGDRRPAGQRIADLDEGLEDRVAVRGEAAQSFDVDGLDDTGSVGSEDRRARRPDRERRHGFAADRVGVAALDRRPGLGCDGCDDGRGAHRVSHVVDVVDERHDRREQEDERPPDRDGRHEPDVADRADLAQDEQGVHERRHEHPEDDLVLAVAQERAGDPW